MRQNGFFVTVYYDINNILARLHRCASNA